MAVVVVVVGELEARRRQQDAGTLAGDAGDGTEEGGDGSAAVDNTGSGRLWGYQRAGLVPVRTCVCVRFCMRWGSVLVVCLRLCLLAEESCRL